MLTMPSDLVWEAIKRGLDAGMARQFPVACAILDGSSRVCGIVRHQDAGWLTVQFAEGKARLASAFHVSTGPMFARLQKERPLYGATLAGLNGHNEWVLAEGGAPLLLKDSQGREQCVGAVGVAGCFPATTDQEVADEVASWLVQQLAALG